MTNLVYYKNISFLSNRLVIAATENGFCYMGTPDEGLPGLSLWAQKHIPQATLIENFDHLEAIQTQLEEYESHKRTTFDLSLDLKGTDFQKKVFTALQRIPFGKTQSYSDIAENLGNKKAVRAVGTAIGKNPCMVVVPCHRVIHKNGSISGFRGGDDFKKHLLSHEGIIY